VLGRVLVLPFFWTIRCLLRMRGIVALFWEGFLPTYVVCVLTVYFRKVNRAFGAAQVVPLPLSSGFYLHFWAVQPNFFVANLYKRSFCKYCQGTKEITGRTSQRGN
jgi:hypothetical protein